MCFMQNAPQMEPLKSHLWESGHLEIPGRGSCGWLGTELCQSGLLNRSRVGAVSLAGGNLGDSLQPKAGEVGKAAPGLELRALQSAPLSYKFISPSLPSFVSFLVLVFGFSGDFLEVFFFFLYFRITLAIIFKAIKTQKRDPRKHPLHSWDDPAVLPAFHPGQRWEAAGCQHHHQGTNHGQSRMIQPKRFQ